ncbi:MAG: 2-C-methyl-D-erythritol 4-phosphate cytidylyltransferase [Rhodothermales bacterium]|nr:2-C-methyl-D-erythritol 4-phosphate cytidylyltransferase [Rhodothermales bacterium]
MAHSPHGKVGVIVPAAGRGRRLGGHRKQFRVLGGKSVLVQTLLVFERHRSVDHIVVATPGEAVDPLTVELRRVGISKLHGVVSGGKTRQESVRAALDALPEDVDVVLIHDAVRPFVRHDRVGAIIDAVRSRGAASLAVAVADTLRRSEGDRFTETVPRESLCRMQTPQGFRRDWIVDAHERAASEDYRATDDVDLVLRTGKDVVRVEGSVENVKITTPADWELATRFWDTWESVVAEELREQIVVDETGWAPRA